MGYGRRRLVRNLWRSVAVAAVIAGIGLGLPAINAEIPATRPVAATAYVVGAGVTLTPPPGTNIDTTQTRPSPTGGQALFYVGSVRYAVVVAPFTGSLASATRELRSRITARSGYQIAGPESPAATSDGIEGRQGTYSSPGRDGRYAVFVSHDLAVEITVAGNGVDLGPLLPSIEASIRSVGFGSR